MSASPLADIVRTEADVRNLSDTARGVEALIHQAQANRQTIICFVTGVPGAGKTLVGLNIATSHREQASTHVVLLQGTPDRTWVLNHCKDARSDAHGFVRDVAC